jgi:hypothetical protein
VLSDLYVILLDIVDFFDTNIKTLATFGKALLDKYIDGVEITTRLPTEHEKLGLPSIYSQHR